MTGTEIKAWRESLGLTQGELARILGVGEDTLVRWERGETKPNTIAQKLLAEVKAGIEKERQNEQK